MDYRYARFDLKDFAFTVEHDFLNISNTQADAVTGIPAGAQCENSGDSENARSGSRNTRP